ncbi:MAG: type II toxin-antitoxin system RelE/ParE family toxin [Candidatus Omnitrophica bacterium]|nr:type II toxin-antitoxin system RelE/ParE family toxin [Candidatus Omnitrophota bacterium]
MTHRIVIEPIALKVLSEITDRRVQGAIRDRIDGLAHDPGLQGKPLVGELRGYRSLRAAGQRYRIIYRVEKSKTLVLVVSLGIRREGDRQDVYALAKKLLRLGLV